MRKLVLGFFALLAVGCSHGPQARNITGPDGSAMVHVSCGADQSACFELAGRSCPTGYTLFPIFDAHDNNYLVRCELGVRTQRNELLASPLPTPAPRALAPSLPPPPAPATVTAWTQPVDSSPQSTALGTDWGY